MKDRSTAGMTTWEIAIVAGFVALFAVAAIPRYGDAQILSGITRARRDMTVIAHAMEAYRLDAATYCRSLPPYDVINLTLLTTPTAYLSAVPVDAFREMAGISSSYRVYGVAYVPTINPTYPEGYRRDYKLFPRVAWVAFTIGPDLLANTGGYFSLPAIIKNEASMSPAIGIDPYGNWIGAHTYNGMRYDPTNGIVSYGDIYYFGSQSRTRAN